MLPTRAHKPSQAAGHAAETHKSGAAVSCPPPPRLFFPARTADWFLHDLVMGPTLVHDSE